MGAGAGDADDQQGSNPGRFPEEGRGGRANHPLLPRRDLGRGPSVSTKNDVFCFPLQLPAMFLGEVTDVVQATLPPGVSMGELVGDLTGDLFQWRTAPHQQLEDEPVAPALLPEGRHKIRRPLPLPARMNRTPSAGG